jgi:hypothetical protein
MAGLNRRHPMGDGAITLITAGVISRRKAASRSRDSKKRITVLNVPSRKDARGHCRLGMSMKAILIDPWEKSIETIDVKSGNDQAALQQLYDLVREDGLDFFVLSPGESIVVGDHSALHNPIWPCFKIGKDLFYGRAVILGYTKAGTDCDTKLTVDDISAVISWYPGTKA